MDGKGVQLLEDRLRQSGGLSAFDPAALIAIIQAIITTIQNCRKPNAQTLRRRLFNRIRLAAAIQRNYPGLTWEQAIAQADVAFDLADKATEEELNLLIADCCH